MTQEKVFVLVSVTEDGADVTYAPDFVDVEIIDWEAYEDGGGDYTVEDLQARIDALEPHSELPYVGVCIESLVRIRDDIAEDARIEAEQEALRGFNRYEEDGHTWEIVRRNAAGEAIEVRRVD